MTVAITGGSEGSANCRSVMRHLSRMRENEPRMRGGIPGCRRMAEAPRVKRVAQLIRGGQLLVVTVMTVVTVTVVVVIVTVRPVVRILRVWVTWR